MRFHLTDSEVSHNDSQCDRKRVCSVIVAVLLSKQAGYTFFGWRCFFFCEFVFETKQHINLLNLHEEYRTQCSITVFFHRIVSFALPYYWITRHSKLFIFWCCCWNFAWTSSGRNDTFTGIVGCIVALKKNAKPDI